MLASTLLTFLCIQAPMTAGIGKKPCEKTAQALVRQAFSGEIPNAEKRLEERLKLVAGKYVRTEFQLLTAAVIEAVSQNRISISTRVFPLTDLMTARAGFDGADINFGWKF